MKLTPFFEIGKKKYELKATRYLMVEYEKIGENNGLNDEDKISAVKLQNMATQVRELALQLSTLKEKYYADMTDESAKVQYKACKEEYDEAFEEMARFEVKNGGSAKLQKATIDALEKIAILGLAEQHFDGDHEKAEEVWCKFVDDKGTSYASEWLVAMAESLFGADEEEAENSFLSQMRAKQEERANNKKKGLARIK